ncbi:DNA cytosine methyltransferase [Streptomyces anulatus]|uniref:DNA cytosine methyltransferase n=1 Tax=Streptomyces anulatus TaxID=1892 RepID=UPI00224CB555|nr:DNA cytosine methyltransferase [Streptomyces anulatus]MCX4523920.1 DNA cytosine methyltransferase [Streptomyces anulatus]WSU78936.1 DNA cytosine methyltransferase [Streptomyces anulatus]
MQLHTSPPPARKQALGGDGPTSTHIFCGLGGDTLGLAEAGFTPTLALNHEPTAVASHQLNFPHCAHDCADVNNYDMRRLPRTRVLFGSPICTEGSPAGGNVMEGAQLEIPQGDGAEDYTPAATWDRTRATAYDLLRAAEVHRYDAVLWENVPRFATAWPLYDWWLKAWELLGYVPQVASVNAAHLGGGPDSSNPRARQDRNRLIGVMVRKGIAPPDLRVRPECVCPECGPVLGIQHWRNPRGRKVGSYGIQYDFVCPNRSCGHRRTVPVTDPVVDVLDLSLPQQRIGDGKPNRRAFTPYPSSTRARVEDALRRFAGPGGERRDGDLVIVHLGRTANPRTVGQPLTTVACTPHHALVRTAATVDDCRIRMVHPTETAEVQRFPEGFRMTGTMKQRYIQVGNAVPVNVAHWAGERLLPSLS